MAGKRKSKGAKAKAAFDEAALEKLTAKIDTELSKPPSKEEKPKQKIESAKKGKSDPELSTPKSKDQSKSKDQPKTKDPKQKSDRPVKRKRNENDNKDAHPKKRQAQEAKSGSSKPKKAAKESKVDLLEEIKLLGGDEADLELIAGIDSDAEEDKAPKAKAAPTDDKALQKELAKFAAGLGFDEVRDEDGATDDELEAQAEGHEDEEWEDDAEEEEIAKEAPPAEKAQGRSAAGKLVSLRRCACRVFRSSADLP